MLARIMLFGEQVFQVILSPVLKVSRKERILLLVLLPRTSLVRQELRGSWAVLF